MPNSNHRKTYFEQIPVEIVKEIAEEDLPDGGTNEAAPPIEPPARKCAKLPDLKPLTEKAT
jgi:hypothetical protein